MPHCNEGLARRGVVLAGDNITNGIIPFPGVFQAAASVPPVDRKTLGIIRALRELWRKTQLSGRGDFDRACLLIAGDEGTTADRYASAFFQGAQIFAHRPMVFLNAKASSASNDEMWLARLLQTLNDSDFASARYLIALRIAPDGRRRLMFLAQGLASHLCPETLVEKPETDFDDR